MIGASFHMSHDRNAFTTYKPYSGDTAQEHRNQYQFCNLLPHHATISSRIINNYKNLNNKYTL
jgi:hypothetical protein